MANKKTDKNKQQEQQVSHTDIQYATNTNAEPVNESVTHAPRPVKKTEKTKALPRSRKK